MLMGPSRQVASVLGKSTTEVSSTNLITKCFMCAVIERLTCRPAFNGLHVQVQYEAACWLHATMSVSAAYNVAQACFSGRQSRGALHSTRAHLVVLASPFCPSSWLDWPSHGLACLLIRFICVPTAAGRYPVGRRAAAAVCIHVTCHRVATGTSPAYLPDMIDVMYQSLRLRWSLS